ncbi:MAG: thioredoxin domain-containing protein [Bacteroidetes bacterium]|nr:thioredoxin domain-containing protein [Bacteroidota bacterium]
MTDKHAYTNALIHSGSPYLLQHAHNPVNWEMWSENAWKRAQEENKLVIVSIGYSTCHWCHVMERETFEDVEMAEAMNEHFICIKVDREERPDIDMVYMDACQLMTGRGGWPLNAICLPDKRPVYTGTYFPKDAWNSILKQLYDLYLKEPEKMLEYGKKVQNGLEEMNLLEFPRTEKTNAADLRNTVSKLAESFDMEYGGLDRSQKFPMPVVQEYLLDEYQISGNEEISDFIHFTLLQMANGGIHDHIRGGFYRYATDKHWFAPHFEKMLYDNAQLISLYSRAYQIFDADIYKKVAMDILAFIERELKENNSGYYSALDADSEGVEGKFYVFQWPELQQILEPNEMELASEIYGLKATGNWEHGNNILHKPLAPLQLLEKTGLTIHEMDALQISIQNKIFTFQNSRIRPSLDHKKLCAWNGLMLKALADAAKYFQDSNILYQAQQQATWMHTHFFRENILYRYFSENGEKSEAFCEDFACYISALISLYEADGDWQWMQTADKLTAICIKHFYDAETGLFYFTSDTSETIMIRKSDNSDDVIPSSGSILALALQKAGIILDNMQYLEIGKTGLNHLRAQVIQNPAWYSNWCRAAQAESIGILQIYITGKYDAEMEQRFRKILPEWALVFTEKNNHVKAMQEKMQGKPGNIYICPGDTCMEPVNSEERAMEILRDLLHYGI